MKLSHVLLPGLLLAAIAGCGPSTEFTCTTYNSSTFEPAICIEYPVGFDDADVLAMCVDEGQRASRLPCSETQRIARCRVPFSDGSVLLYHLYRPLDLDGAQDYCSALGMIGGTGSEFLVP